MIADIAPWGDPAVLGGVGTALVAVVGALLWWLRGRSSTPALEDHAEELPPDGLAARLRDRMAATRAALQGRFDQIFSGKVDESALESLEDALILADVGPTTTSHLLGGLRTSIRKGERDPQALRGELRDTIRRTLDGVARPWTTPSRRGDQPHVILVVGVNGSGKTTTIGKLAAHLRDEGKKVVLAAGDTYRAAAADQLAIWAERGGARLVRREEGADPASVAHDALEVAAREGADVVIVDTAGRLQTKRPLMEELSKVRRVIGKKIADAPHDTLLVIDGTMGQNAMSQARSFHEATPISGVVVTKLDGTAKGGIVVALAHDLKLPVQWVGIGEKVDDLRPFDAGAFVDALT